MTDAPHPSPAPAPAAPAAPAAPGAILRSSPRAASGALAPLLDIRFTRFIAVRIVQALYLIGVGIIAFATLVGLIALFRAGFAFGLTGLIFLPLVAFVAVLALRVSLEMVVALFRIAENTSRLVETAERR